MATTFKTFLNNDITSTKTLLHEAIPLTGTIASGTYNTAGATGETYNGTNIKNYAHGMFQSVYDYPYLSSSANHIFDLTVGYASDSSLSASSATTMQSKKINIYNQMAQVLVGYDTTGSIRNFDEDGNLVDVGAGSGTKLKDCIFINFARLLAKDEIKKGSFTLKLGTGSYAAPFDGSPAGSDSILTISDSGKENDYRVNSPAGEYAILSATVGYSTSFKLAPACGLIFYQAGIVVLSSSIFQSGSESKPYAGILNTGYEGIPFVSGAVAGVFSGMNISSSLSGNAISSSCNYFRNRIYDISFNNTTELNSTIHFCRINHNDFNYSSNPTYLSSSKIVVKNNTLDAPISYITTVGLYSSDNELLAVAKLSEALKKDPTNEMTIRVRLDY